MMIRIAIAAAVALAASASCAAAQTRVDYCQYGSQSSLLLLDRTTPYDANDQRAVLDSVAAIADRLQTGERFVVATIGAHYSTSVRAFNECVPGCPPAKDWGGIMDACRPMIARHDRQQFRARLVGAIRPLLINSTDTPTSDITGTIAQSTQHPPSGRTFARVYIYSDMLENSLALPWHEFRQMSAEQSMSVVRSFGLLPDTPHAQITIAGYGRLNDPARSPLPPLLDQALRRFWTEYFEAGGASAPSFENAVQ
ncbi:MAG: hypothetical protein ABUS57_01860 [Pseudomonadota bacterium]